MRRFTIVEMLVVVAILAVLLALLLPALKRAHEQTLEVWCGSNLHQLSLGFFAFSEDLLERFPGQVNDGTRWPGHKFPYVGWHPDEDQKNDWLGCRLPAGAGIYGPENVQRAPSQGTLFPYTSLSPKIYRCPALDTAELGSGQGSNGAFDYAAVLKFTGAILGRITLEARYRTGANYSESVEVKTPMVMDEAPWAHNNSGSIDGSHSWIDKLGADHRGGGNIAAMDGSVYWLMEPQNTDFRFWESMAPSSTWTALGAAGTGIYNFDKGPCSERFGDWNGL